MKKFDTRVKLSVLWIAVLMNILFADVFSIMVELVEGNTLNVPGDVKTVMAVAAVITNIPILMIFFSRILKYEVNRILNMTAAVITIVYVIGGGDTAPHYIIMAAIEVVLLLTIIVSALKWTNPVVE